MTKKEHKKLMDLQLTCSHSDLGSCLFPCPWCGIYGFYAMKDTPNKVMRACKWCGVWQKFKGKPYRCILLGCKKCKKFDHTENNLDKPCEICGEKMIQYKHPIEQMPDYPNRDDMLTVWEIKEDVYNIHQYPKYGHKISKELINLMLNGKQ